MQQETSPINYHSLSIEMYFKQTAEHKFCTATLSIFLSFTYTFLCSQYNINLQSCHRWGLIRDTVRRWGSGCGIVVEEKGMHFEVE